MERNGGATFLSHLEEMAAFRGHGPLPRTIAFVVLREASSSGYMFFLIFMEIGFVNGYGMSWLRVGCELSGEKQKHKIPACSITVKDQKQKHVLSVVFYFICSQR